jgi:hypothetical protein
MFVYAAPKRTMAVMVQRIMPIIGSMVIDVIEIIGL